MGSIKSFSEAVVRIMSGHGRGGEVVVSLSSWFRLDKSARPSGSLVVNDVREVRAGTDRPVGDPRVRHPPVAWRHLSKMTPPSRLRLVGRAMACVRPPRGWTPPRLWSRDRSVMRLPDPVRVLRPSGTEECPAWLRPAARSMPAS
jgi:hypothetical protein